MKESSIVCMLLCLLAVPVGHVDAGTLRNTLAELSELGKFLRYGGKLKRASYDFEPAAFSFLSTNAVHRLRFRPRRAVPHKVVVSYPTDGCFSRKEVRRALDAFSVRLTVRHGGKDEMTLPFRGGETPSGVSYKWVDGHVKYVDGRAELEMEHVLFRFHAGEFDWYYRDEIELTLEICSPVNMVSVPDSRTPRLTLREGWIIQ